MKNGVSGKLPKVSDNRFFALFHSTVLLDRYSKTAIPQTRVVSMIRKTKMVLKEAETCGRLDI